MLWDRIYWSRLRIEQCLFFKFEKKKNINLYYFVICVNVIVFCVFTTFLTAERHSQTLVNILY